MAGCPLVPREVGEAVEVAGRARGTAVVVVELVIDGWS